jgi:hypothetical protein
MFERIMALDGSTRPTLVQTDAQSPRICHADAHVLEPVVGAQLDPGGTHFGSTIAKSSSWKLVLDGLPAVEKESVR